MNIPAELHVLGLVLMVFCVAYFAIFPKVKDKTLHRLMLIDLALVGILLAMAGSVYVGTGTPFSLLVIYVPWWVFTLITAVIVEVPFFLWFCRTWGIDLSGDEPGDD